MNTHLYRWLRSQPVLAYRGLLLFFVGALFYLGSQEKTVQSLPMPMHHMDKLYHFCAFSFIAVMGWFSFRQPRFAAPVAAAMLVGIADELHQSTLAFRTADPCDWLTDVMAGVTVGLVLQYWHRRAEASRASVLAE